MRKVSKEVCNKRRAVAERVCDHLEEDERVKHMVEECAVDDWDDWCRGYSMFISLPVREIVDRIPLYIPKKEGEFDLRALTWGIKRAVKTEPAALNWIEHPEGKWKRKRDRMPGESALEGYKRPFTQFDLDVLLGGE
jgi:hypothetical protein